MEADKTVLKSINVNGKIKHVFLLMLENHSFDNIFGCSGIHGINGLTGSEDNCFQGEPYKVGNTAPDYMPSDPGHEFLDTVEQLCGQGKIYGGGAYPPVDNSGFVANYATSSTESTKCAPGPPPLTDIGDIMLGFNTKSKLPVIYQLAQEFAICDTWFSSMPGPTWPNRFFAYAGSSAGLDDSPTKDEMLEWETIEGVAFNNGTIFDALPGNFNLYQDRYWELGIPIFHALKGVHFYDIADFSRFSDDLSNNYSSAFTVIEPNYGDFEKGTYCGGSSQHPMDGMVEGEKLIKRTYEAIRNSPIWDSSMLIITYDEHGGFYDHVAPPSCVPPGDGAYPDGRKKHGFDFTKLGVRVPAVVVSPYINKNTIDHTVYDHTSVLRTVEELNDLNPLTRRDRLAKSLTHLLSLNSPRTDCTTILNEPFTDLGGIRPKRTAIELEIIRNSPLPESGNMIGFLQIAMKTDYELSGKTQEGKIKILAHSETIKTIGDAEDYINEVITKRNAVLKMK